MDIVNHLDVFSAQVTEAADRIRSHVRLTPIEPALFLNELCQANVFIKMGEH